ncbi:hypothetical protein [Formosimonas limnophila]|uniref:hypothetical protein n=1 Tax=Formosimonas limnophila TaxID=1384487 RepID=UPI001672D562|nr:hypothetical protein [Formosimonas limnophila]
MAFGTGLDLVAGLRVGLLDVAFLGAIFFAAGTADGVLTLAVTLGIFPALATVLFAAGLVTATFFSEVLTVFLTVVAVRVSAVFVIALVAIVAPVSVYWTCHFEALVPLHCGLSKFKGQ